ncbi:hypothetical protein CAEBREN_32346 [Caenorhabditis brenneri]|uniref:Uncharacterized protein n=1 Tax=Caenorhabditis brenneri TaxID=135651 RepID=G0NKV1_CAEBE|nr:hypothetical protein CAEBREN_32346 [Caenorhabditis brenneri]
MMNYRVSNNHTFCSGPECALLSCIRENMLKLLLVDSQFIPNELNFNHSTARLVS